uniref:Uncharacterized protein n=1 Tax=Arundo donax TaxID=35708 RepID=A0A0A9HZ95_ARUDO
MERASHHTSVGGVFTRDTLKFLMLLVDCWYQASF